MTEHKPGLLTDPTKALNFILAGNATITLKSLKTETRFTYRIRVSDDKERFYVHLLVGPDNENSYQFLGTIFAKHMRYAHGKKSAIGYDSQSAQAFIWAFNLLSNHLMHDSLEIWHEGKCCRCGRKLTTPESISLGIGPECLAKQMEVML